MSKGEETRTAVLDQALNLASEVGLEGLTFGSLAKQAGLSKSGLYAHFGSKEELQCQVLDTAADRFTENVLKNAFSQPRGLPRIQTMFDGWLKWGAEAFPGGCPFIAAAAEFDDRTGPVRDLLVEHMGRMLEMMSRAARFAVDEGHFHPSCDTEQFAYEYWALLLGHHHYHRLLKSDETEMRTRRAFAGLIARAAGPETSG